jgi:integrase
VAYYLRGKEMRESTRGTDQRQAEKFLQARLREVGADEIGARAFVTPQARRIKVHELVETLRADFAREGKLSPQNISYLKKVDMAFGEYRAASLTREVVDAYIDKQLAEGYANGSVNRVTQLLHQCFEIAIRDKKLSDAPYIRNLKEDNIRQGNFTEEQLAATIDALPEHLRDFTRWASITGQRKGELRQLTFSMIEGDTLKIPGRICKNRDGRVLPLTTEMQEILMRRAAARQIEVDGATILCNLIFHKNGKRLGQCQKEWKQAVEAANCPDLVFHDLRRFAVTALTNAGVPQSIAMKVSGHKTEAMFKRYQILVTDEVRSAMERTQELRAQAIKTKSKVVAMR